MGFVTNDKAFSRLYDRQTFLALLLLGSGSIKKERFYSFLGLNRTELDKLNGFIWKKKSGLGQISIKAQPRNQMSISGFFFFLQDSLNSRGHPRRVL